MEKKIFFCALRESEAETFQKKILDVDQEAFIYFLSSRESKETDFIYINNLRKKDRN